MNIEVREAKQFICSVCVCVCRREEEERKRIARASINIGLVVLVNEDSSHRKFLLFTMDV